MPLRIGFCLTLFFVFPAALHAQTPTLSDPNHWLAIVGDSGVTGAASSPDIEPTLPNLTGQIWGALVPYGEVWRTGANSATKITFSKDVMIETTAVPAGTYAFFAIPTATTWTLILSKEPNQPGAFAYKKENDLLRVTVKPTAVPIRERLAYAITNFTDDAASIDLEWEKLRVTLPVKLKTAEQAAANIKEATDGSWMPMNNAARYLLDQKQYPAAMEKVDASIAVRETWLNDWTKAQILAGQGKYKDALALADKAKTLGEQTPKDFFAADEVKKALAEWKTKG